MVASGLRKGVVAERPGRTCHHCERVRAKRTAFGRSGREEKLDTGALLPFMHSTIDLFGPHGQVGDRNGHRFLWGAVCQATAVNFLQPLSAKSQSKEALRLYSRLIDVVAPTVEAKLKYPAGTLLWGRALASDRDGAFTTDNGFTKSMVDEMTAGLGFTPYFGSAGTPETASVQVGRLWQKIARAADASMLASGMLWKYYVHRRAPYGGVRAERTAHVE